MNIKVNLQDGTPAQFKTEIVDGNLVVTVVEEEKQEANLFPKWEGLGAVKGYYVSSDAETKYAIDFRTFKNNENIFTTEDLAKAALATARVSQTYKRYRELVNDSSILPVVREYGLLRMNFVSLFDWDSFFDANEEDFILIARVANIIQL